jgi:outer membrane protein assembly factor BamB
LIRRTLLCGLLTIGACAHATTPAVCTPQPARATAGWSAATDRAPAAAAVDAVGVVVTSADDSVVALDRHGSKQWRAHVVGAGLDWPVIDGDIAVVPTASADERVGCTVLDRATGQRRYAVDVGKGVGGAVGVAPAVVVCAAADGRIAAVDRASGRVRWSVDAAAQLGGQAEVSARGALVVDPASSRVALVAATPTTWMLACWNLATGAHEPGCDVDLGPSEPPSAAVSAGPGAVLVGSGDARAVLLIDLGTGAVRAAVPVAQPFDPANIPLVQGDRAVVVDRLGGVTAIDLHTGMAMWRADLGEVVLDAKPSVSGGVVHLVDWTGRVHHLRLADGRAAAAVDARGGAVAAVADPAGTLLVTLRRGAGNDGIEGALAAAPGPKASQTRPLQCLAEPGHSIRNDARP